MASFPLKTHICLPLPFNLKFENIFLALDRCNFARLCLKHMANYLCKKFFSMTYRLATIHQLRTTNGQTDNTSCHIRLQHSCSASKNTKFKNIFSPASLLLAKLQLEAQDFLGLTSYKIRITHFYSQFDCRVYYADRSAGASSSAFHRVRRRTNEEHVTSRRHYCPGTAILPFFVVS